AALAGADLRGRQDARLGASAALARFRSEVRRARNLTDNLLGDEIARREGLDRVRRALESVHALDDPSWPARAPVPLLPAGDLRALRDEAGELLAMLARSEARRANTLRHKDAKRQALGDAARIAAQAETSFGPDRVPRGLREQQADLARRLGDTDE